MTSNRHPVDELADIRTQIKALETRESVLKEAIIHLLSDPPFPGDTQRIDGDEYVASVSLIESHRLDRKEVEKALSPKRFALCLKPSVAITVRVSPRQQQEAA